MPAMIRCSVCLHPQVREIDSWLRDATGRGQPRSRIAKKFGLGQPALARHLRNGHWKDEPTWQALDASRRAAQAPRLPAPPSGPVALDGIAQLEDMLGKLAAVDTTGYSPRDLNVHNDQLRRTAESVARLKPPADKEGPAQAQVKILTGMMDAYDRVLDAHPEIAREVADALHAFKRDRGLE